MTASRQAITAISKGALPSGASRHGTLSELQGFLKTSSAFAGASKGVVRSDSKDERENQVKEEAFRSDTTIAEAVVVIRYFQPQP